MSHHTPTSESLKAFLAARERVEDRKRLAALEEALGVFLHIRDQVDDLEDAIGRYRHQPDLVVDPTGPVFERLVALNSSLIRAAEVELEALGRRELDVVEKLRDLMVTA